MNRIEKRERITPLANTLSNAPMIRATVNVVVPLLEGKAPLRVSNKRCLKHIWACGDDGTLIIVFTHGYILGF